MTKEQLIAKAKLRIRKTSSDMLDEDVGQLVEVALADLKRIGVHSSYLDEAETSVRIQIFLGILALSWGAMIASFILYTRLRSAAVTASALLAFALYALLSCLLGKDGGGLVGELIWLLYSIWGAACFVLSSLIVLFKPAIFIRSAKSAFFSTLIINAASLSIVIL